MSIKQHIDADLKAAMLSGDKILVTTLRTLKSAVLYAEVASGRRENGLDDKDVIELFRKEAKKRQESAELYTRGGNQAKADAELAEIKAIEVYLPAQLSDKVLQDLIEQAVSEQEEVSPQALGKIIARVKELSGGAVDGGRIAAGVKERLQK
ncbi:MAG TPA: GatB/YqeY domain-containing protein [Candidatus Limnocylindria bacterium]|nr:GatB/YqeY domain-containing protein [Candidatus Limnocylindria bacterium]